MLFMKATNCIVNKYNRLTEWIVSAIQFANIRLNISNAYKTKRNGQNKQRMC